ncbi:MAG: hypothetical protein ABR508_00450 [Candidatus Baltobacteraceae bacterium]
MQVLALLRRRTEKFSDEQFAPLLEPEAQAVRALYAEGTIRAMWSRDDAPGAAVLLEAAGVQEARGVVETLPLMRARMLEIEQIIPLRGYRGFAPRS